MQELLLVVANATTLIDNTLNRAFSVAERASNDEILTLLQGDEMKVKVVTSLLRNMYPQYRHVLETTEEVEQADFDGLLNMKTLMHALIRLMGAARPYHMRPHTTSLSHKVLGVVVMAVALASSHASLYQFLMVGHCDLSSRDRFAVAAPVALSIINYRGKMMYIMQLLSRICDGHETKYINGSGKTAETTYRITALHTLIEAM